MKCTCRTCDGSGRVICHDCGGEGEWEKGIESLSLGDLRSLPHDVAERLMDLRSQAKVVRRQCKELTELMPHNMDKYLKEAEAVIEQISKQAEDVYKFYEHHHPPFH